VTEKIAVWMDEAYPNFFTSFSCLQLMNLGSSGMHMMVAELGPTCGASQFAQVAVSVSVVGFDLF